MILPTSIRLVTRENLRQKVETLPEEVRHNAAVLYHILDYTNRLMPAFSDLPDKDTKTIADMVAYMMRTDLLLRVGPYVIMGPKLLLQGRIPVDNHDSESLDVLANDPDRLRVGWSLVDERERIKDCWTLHNRSSEFARCYQFVVHNFFRSMRDEWSASGDRCIPEFTLADMTAYLLDVNDLDDYRYTEEERHAFHQRLCEAWKEEMGELL
jgi:hypothetical protein